MKYTIILLIGIFLTGCGSITKEKTVYNDVLIPIQIVPPPPDIPPVDYYASHLSEEQMNDNGELTKAYIISSQQAINDAQNLRKVYNLYKKLAENSENRLNALENLGMEVDRSLLEQGNKEVESELQALSNEIDFENEEHSESIRQSLMQMSQ
jgi:hypothetical protein